jgi:hypothetical protein
VGIGNHFVCCDICGGAGHKAKHCGLQRLEARKDPFGEEIRKNGYRRGITQRPSLIRLSAGASIR